VVSRSQSHIEIDGQSVSLSWCRAPSEDHDQILVTISQFFALPMWGALSDERTGLLFVNGDWSNSCSGLYSRDRSPATFLPRRLGAPRSRSEY
jgi:hypothetical protein